MARPVSPLRVGVVVMPWRGLNDAALRFLVLAMNLEQKLLQFEFHDPEPVDPLEPGDPLLTMLHHGHGVVSHSLVREHLPAFAARMHEYLAQESGHFECAEPPPEQFVVISRSRLDDNYYSDRNGRGAVIALGNWKRYMAPPSLLEFVQVLLIREAVGAACPSLSRSVHLGTKGCLMDFSKLLSEARYKALRGHVCHSCRARMRADGQQDLADTVDRLLDREWLGSSSDPRSPAGVAANLGYDLFISKGRRATPREVFLNVLRQEGARQVATVVGLVIATAILVLLGLKTAG